MEVEIVILLTLITAIKSEVCQKTGPCSCKTSAGVVDLSALPLSVSADDDQGYTNTWYPCNGGSCGGVNGVSICQKQTKVPNPSSYRNGYLNTSTFIGEPEKNLVLKYFGDPKESSSTTYRQSSISLICDNNAEVNTFTAEGEQPPAGSVQYKFTLRSKHACIVSSGISAGSVLLILFFVFVLVYVIGGILFLRFYRGASGVEMIPNYEFWKDFPFLVKDGMVFTFRGCKRDTTYSQI